MKRYLVVGVAVIAAAIALILSAFRVVTAPPTPPPVHVALPVVPHAYFGAFERGAPPSYQPVATFAKAAGKAPNLAGYFSGWAEPFATKFARMISRRHQIPFVQIDPTLASVSGIAAGYYDRYLRSYADSVRNYGHAVVIGFGHEMNAPWYSWGYGHVSPHTFVAAWRHIVTLFKSQGALNVTWLWTVNADQPGTGPVASWWPGDKYVTWVGIDGLYMRPGDNFSRVFGATIQQVQIFTRKPILISETAVSPRLNEFEAIGDLFHGVHLTGALGLMWFDIIQHGGISHQDWRIENATPAADAAFRLGAGNLKLFRPNS
jgi:mannan endo-1,4-beta-mannosidase